MSEHCSPERRSRHRRLHQLREDVDAVVDVTLRSPESDPSDRWTTELLVQGPRVAPGILEAIAAQDLGIATITPKAAGDYREVVVR